MSRKSIKGSPELAKSIKQRRNELDLTIEDAASIAGVGTKTWSRYEAGESIRRDKCRGICKALNWLSLPGIEEQNTVDFDQYKNHKAWSSYLADAFGVLAATSFVIGSDILLDHIEDDMERLSSMPKGSHIGEIDISWLESSLPSQFLMRYDYDFLYSLRDAVTRFRLQANAGAQIVAHTVVEELVLYLIVGEAQFLMEMLKHEMEDDDMVDFEGWDDWVFDLFDDMDIVTFLYSNLYLEEDNTYHFAHWLERQFYC